LVLVNGRRGFTAVELVMTLVIIGVITAFGFPSVAGQLRRTRVNQAAQIVAADLEIATSLATRDQRAMVFEGHPGDYVIRDRASGAVRFRRTLGATSDWRLEPIRYEPSVVEFYPSGIASSPMRVYLGSQGYIRRVMMTRAGYVRVLP